MIGQFATCDIENYGDLIYPLIFRSMMRKRGWADDIGAYAFLPGLAPGNAGYNVSSIANLLNAKHAHIDTLIIGGGDILRTDTVRFASHYESIYKRRRERNFIYKLQKTLLRKPNLKKEFMRRFINYGAIGPFVIDAKRYPSIKSVVYCSCGVPFEFREEEKESIREALDNAMFIYVRDRQSRDKLVGAGVQRDIHVAPDLIVTLSDFFDREVEKQKGIAILRAWDIDVRKKVLCFQCLPQSIENETEIVKQLTSYKQRTDSEVILMPIGHCHGDANALKRLAAKSEGSLKYVGLYSIFDMISVLAACDLFLGTSMHGNITAFSFGIPHLFGNIQVDKAKGFLDIAELSTDLKLKSWSQINEKLDMVTS
ncbi:polysaccharide pyruvyl transferase family protein, partial [bacterium]|nr:polysaccharide pyruvyl transferase family protein [bacterium]